MRGRAGADAWRDSSAAHRPDIWLWGTAILLVSLPPLAGEGGPKGRMGAGHPLAPIAPASRPHGRSAGAKAPRRRCFPGPTPPQQAIPAARDDPRPRRNVRATSARKTRQCRFRTAHCGHRGRLRAGSGTPAGYGSGRRLRSISTTSPLAHSRTWRRHRASGYYLRSTTIAFGFRLYVGRAATVANLGIPASPSNPAFGSCPRRSPARVAIQGNSRRPRLAHRASGCFLRWTTVSCKIFPQSSFASLAQRTKTKRPALRRAFLQIHARTRTDPARNAFVRDALLFRRWHAYRDECVRALARHQQQHGATGFHVRRIAAELRNAVHGLVAHAQDYVARRQAGLRRSTFDIGDHDATLAVVAELLAQSGRDVLHGEAEQPAAAAGGRRTRNVLGGEAVARHLADLDLDVSRLAVAQDAHGNLGSGLGHRDHGRNLRGLVDLASID